MKRGILITTFLLSLLVLTACTTTEFAEVAEHSQDWNLIMETLDAQCNALRSENINDLASLYAYPENSIENSELRMAAARKFKDKNTVSCYRFIDKIEFTGSRAEVFMNLIVEEREGIKLENVSTTVPNENGNDYIFKKIGDEWKFCPNNDCRGTKTEKFVCETGELAEDEFGCPELIEGDISLTPLAQCLDNMDVERVLRPNIGPYILQEESIKLIEDAPTGGISKIYQGDYMKKDDEKRLFNYAFIQGENEDAYQGIQAQFLDDINTIDRQYESAEVSTLFYRDSESIRLQVGRAPSGQQFLFIRNRVYVAIPEHNAFMRFMFNDWVNIEDVDPLVRTYLNSICETDVQA